jgi:L-lactate dehydrogenase complex protein LldG
MNARDEILTRLRGALGPAPVAPEVPRAYRADDATDPAGRLDLFVDRLVDYKAVVTRCGPDGIATAVADALTGADRVVTPLDVPGDWLRGYPGVVLPDEGLGVADLDGADAVLTGCAAAIAETGTIVLDAGVAQGRRALSLVPDHHVCVVAAEQVVGTVPAGLRRLIPTRPLTFISGPSATSDIELDRVEGVHGPRRLHVVLVAPRP